MNNELISLYSLGVFYAFAFYTLRKNTDGVFNTLMFFHSYYEMLGTSRIAALIVATYLFFIGDTKNISVAWVFFFPHEYTTVLLYNKLRLYREARRFRTAIDRKIDSLSVSKDKERKALADMKRFSGLITESFANSVYGTIGLIHSGKHRSAQYSVSGQLASYTLLTCPKVRQVVLPLLLDAFNKATLPNTPRYPKSVLRNQPYSFVVENPEDASKHSAPGVKIDVEYHIPQNETDPFFTGLTVVVYMTQRLGKHFANSVQTKHTFKFQTYPVGGEVFIDSCTVSSEVTYQGEETDGFRPFLEFTCTGRLETNCDYRTKVNGVAFIKNAKLKRWTLNNCSVQFLHSDFGYSVIARRRFNRESSALANLQTNFVELQFGHERMEFNDRYGQWAYPHAITFGLTQPPQELTKEALEQTLWRIT